MKMRLLIALTLLASAAWALPIFYIDTFNLTGQTCASADPACLSPGIVANPAPDAVGNVRKMQLGGVGGTLADVTGRVISSVGYLSFSQDVESFGILYVTWADGADGLHLDATQGGHAVKFEMRVHSDNGMHGTLTVNTYTGGDSSAPFFIPAWLNPNDWTILDVPFSAFTGDLTDVRSILLTLDGTSSPEADVAVDYLGVSTPEPGSLLLIGGGLLGLSFLRRRMRRA